MSEAPESLGPFCELQRKLTRQMLRLNVNTVRIHDLSLFNDDMTDSIMQRGIP